MVQSERKPTATLDGRRAWQRKQEHTFSRRLGNRGQTAGKPRYRTHRGFATPRPRPPKGLLHTLLPDWRWQIVLAVVFIPAVGSIAAAQPPAPPTNVRVEDAPNDAGTKLTIRWDLSPDDVAEPESGKPKVVRYDILRKAEGEDEFKNAGQATSQTTETDDPNCKRGTAYLYQVVAVGPRPDGESSEPAVAAQAVRPVMQWFKEDRAWLSVFLILVGGAIVYFIQVGRPGRPLNVRKIAGLEAVDEAVGRATEMGRSCLFIPGILDINEMQTIAGLTVLSRVATQTAEYGAKLEVPTSRSLVMTAARETVQASYLGAGRPDAYVEDDIYYLSDEQFGFVAGVTGSMMREKPAACFYMGVFFAESLILAETGNAIGAIQVAGTAMPSQLPFFVAACDYTLIGEEFFAASAYLSGETTQLGSLKGQDMGKVLAGVLLFIGCGLATLAAATADSVSFVETSDALAAAVSFLTENVLGTKGFLP